MYRMLRGWLKFILTYPSTLCTLSQDKIPLGPRSIVKFSITITKPDGCFLYYLENLNLAMMIIFQDSILVQSDLISKSTLATIQIMVDIVKPSNFPITLFVYKLHMLIKFA